MKYSGLIYVKLSRQNLWHNTYSKAFTMEVNGANWKTLIYRTHGLII